MTPLFLGLWIECHECIDPLFFILPIFAPASDGKLLDMERNTRIQRDSLEQTYCGSLSLSTPMIKNREFAFQLAMLL